jgi:aspartyl/asparaginyl beta-hydroxylase (cupin superfamily)
MKKALWQAPIMRAQLSQGRELVTRMARAFQAAPDDLKKSFLASFMSELIPANKEDEFAPRLRELDANICAWEPARKEMELLGMESIFDWAWGKELITVARAQVHNDPELMSQRPFLFIPGIKPQPFWPIEEYDWAKDLKKEHGAIKHELQKLKEMPELFLPYNPVEARNAGINDVFIKRKNSDNLSDWNGFFLSSPYEKGVRKDFMELCPHTTAVIQAIPRINWDEMLFFSALTPGAIIPPHFGPHNAHLRLHLCLEADGPVYVRVGDHVREIKEGDLYAFDDSYLHSVINEGKRTRVNLMLSIIHPEVPDHVVKSPAMPTEARLSDWDKEARQALAKSRWWV